MPFIWSMHRKNRMSKQLTDPFDIVKIALEADLLSESVYVDRWGTWVTVQELTGKERGEYLGQCMDKEGNVNFKKLNPLMAVLSARYPDPYYPPKEDHPHYKEFPGLKDEQDNFLTDPHPKAGQIIFNLSQMGPLNQKSGAALEQIAQVAGRLSALRPEDVEKKKKTLNSDDWESEPSTIE